MMGAYLAATVEIPDKSGNIPFLYTLRAGRSNRFMSEIGRGLSWSFSSFPTTCYRGPASGEVRISHWPERNGTQ